MSNYIVEIRQVHSRRLFFLQPDNMSFEELHKHILKIPTIESPGMLKYNPEMTLNRMVVDTFRGLKLLIGWVDIYKDDGFSAEMFISRVRSGEPITQNIDNM